MKRLASLLLALGLLAAPTMALADFHEHGGLESLYKAQASSEKEAPSLSEEGVLRAESSESREDLWSPREEDIG